MLGTKTSLDALSAVKQKLETSDEYWRIKNQAKEHLASVRGADVDDVKHAIKSFLRTSGNALKLQNLAYALKHGLVLPFDAAPENLHSGLAEQEDDELSPHQTAAVVSDTSASALHVAEREESASELRLPSQQSSIGNCSVDLHRCVSHCNSQPDMMHDRHPPTHRPSDSPGTLAQNPGTLEPPANERLHTLTQYTAAPAKTTPHARMPPPSPDIAAAGISPALHPSTYTSQTPPGAAAAHCDSPTHMPPDACTHGIDSNALDAPCSVAAEACSTRSVAPGEAAPLADVPAAQAVWDGPATAPRTWAQAAHPPPNAHTAATAPQQAAVAPQADPAASWRDRLPGTATVEPPPMLEPPAMQALRDHWQAVVVDRLMRLAAAVGEPLAQRALSPAQLSERRAAHPGSASERIACAAAVANAAGPPLDLAVIPMPLLQRGVAAALAGAAEVPGCDTGAGADLLRLRGPEVVVPLPLVAAEVAARVPKLPWLREHFGGLHPRHRQCGSDDRRSAAFARGSAAEARATVVGGEVPAALAALRRGAPRCCRAALWSTALCVAPDDQRSVEHFEALCARVEERRLLVDGAVAAGVAALSDEEDFFLFAEPLRAAALAFSRDPSAAAHAAAPPHPRLVGLGRGGQRHGLYPPGGVLPHGGAAALLAPLPYLFPTAAGVMMCHRALYCRHWCKLTSLSAQGAPAPCMPVLVATFAALLEHAEPGLEAHLAGVCAFSARDCAVAWLARGFVGVLDVEEVLLLWDRVIGYDSLLVLPLAAAAVLAWRGAMLRECSTVEEVAAVLENLSQLQIVPLLQSLLFLTGRNGESE